MGALEEATRNDPENLIKIIAVGGGLCIAAIAIVFSTVKNIVRGKERERTRREIAAYVAEGSMTSDEGERLLIAGESEKKGGCWS